MLPNCLIVGAVCAGTSSLFAYLRKHPDIFFPDQKEVNYFVVRYSLGLDWYERQFAGHQGEKIVGDATPSYMHREEVPARIRAHLPRCRLIFCLRNPIERAHSHHWMKVTKAEEVLTFDECVRVELSPPAGYRGRRPNYLGIGRYGEQVERYLKYFDRKQLHFVIFEDFIGDPQAELERIYAFLGVEPGFVPPNIGVVKNPVRRKYASVRSQGLHMLFYALRWFLGRLYSALGARFYGIYRSLSWQIIGLYRKVNLAEGRVAEMSPRTRKPLREFYREDIDKLQRLTGVDLDHWQWESRLQDVRQAPATGSR